MACKPKLIPFVQESADMPDWDKDMHSLQERMMSQAEQGEVSSVANELAKAASEVADVARASLSSTDEGQPSNFGLSPEEHKEGESYDHQICIAKVYSLFMAMDNYFKQLCLQSQQPFFHILTLFSTYERAQVAERHISSTEICQFESDKHDT